MWPELWAQEELEARRAQRPRLPHLPLVLPWNLGEERGWLLGLQRHQGLEGSPWVSTAPPPAQATGPTRSRRGRGGELPVSPGFLHPLLVGSGELGASPGQVLDSPHIPWFYEHVVTHCVPGLLWMLGPRP